MPSLRQDSRCLITAFAMLALLLAYGVDSRPHGGYDPQLHLEAIKQTILAKLGMEKPPAIREALGQDELQKAHQLYQEMLTQLGATQTTATMPGATVHLLRPTLKPMVEVSSGSLPRTGGHSGHLYSLELSRTVALHQNLKVLRAELSLLKQLLDHPGIMQPNSTWTVHVNIYKMANGSGATPKLLTSQVLSATSLTLSLRDAMEHWLAGPEQRLHLGLEFSADVAVLVAAAMTREGTEALPLEVETQERGKVRKVRQLDEECDKGYGNCCLRTLKVSFEAIGWSDWVVAPSSYSMKFCEGSCPHNYKPASMHAQIKARLHSLSGETPAPCCVPAAYEPMVLMHYGSDEKVVTQLFDDMIVTGCHCA
ncbi:growth/differentiation factor 15 [Tiliqua scincoides]|uniref:growth/differentiation factor 15 n=1 Tax=Tiliqua scincoides TaxID=71010 RepID=UPI0034636EC0